MAYSTSPIVGINLEEVVQADAPEKDFTKIGLTVRGDDGHAYILVESDGSHVAGADIAIDAETLAVTAGAGAGAYSVAADDGVVAGDLFWARFDAL